MPESRAQRERGDRAPYKTNLVGMAHLYTGIYSPLDAFWQGPLSQKCSPKQIKSENQRRERGDNRHPVLAPVRPSASSRKEGARTRGTSAEPPPNRPPALPAASAIASQRGRTTSPGETLPTAVSGKHDEHSGHWWHCALHIATGGRHATRNVPATTAHTFVLTR